MVFARRWSQKFAERLKIKEPERARGFVEKEAAACIDAVILKVTDIEQHVGKVEEMAMKVCKHILKE